MSTNWSRLVRFTTPESSTPLVGEPVDAEVDVGLALYEKKAVEVNLFSGSSVLSAGEKTGKKATIGTLLSPVSEAEVGTIRCIGLNYVEHAKEAKLDLPPVPVLFMKPSTSLLDPYPAQVVVPKFTIKDNAADYESELCVIIGKTAKDVSEADALSYVLGYTASNDISSRKVQFEQSQWCFSKSFDTACPIGPTVVSTKAIPDPSKLHMKGFKNGKKMQDSGIDDLYFNVPKLISFLSQGTTLKPGTIILTGTPIGPGWFINEVLQHEDEFRVEIDGGIGTLINKIVFEQ